MNNTAVSQDERAKHGRNAGIVGIAVNVVLFAVKLAVGIISGSLSVAADAVNNLSDALSSIFVLVGYVISAKPADKDHPYGHARVEYLCGLFISVIVTVLGIEMLKSSVEAVISPSDAVKFSTVAVIVMLVTVAAKIGLAVFYSAVGKKIGSQSLRASAADSIGDVAATAAVVVGMLLTPVFGPRTDGVLGIIIALYIIILGIKLVKESSGTLIGEAPDKELVTALQKKVRSYDGVLGVHDLVIHSYGAGKIFASIHVEADASGDPIEIHDTVDNIEEEVRREMGIDLVVHTDPICTSDERINSLRHAVSQIVTDIGAETEAHVSMHDFRVVFGVTHTNIVFDVAVDIDMKLTDRELSDKLSAKIRALDPTYNTVVTVDREYHTERFGEEMK